MMSSASDPFMQIEETANSRKSLPLTIRDLTVAYHRKPVIWDIDLSIPEGEAGEYRGSQWRGKEHLD